MTGKSRRRHRQKEEAVVPEEPQGQPEGWISRRTGLIIITLLSVVLGLFIGAQVMPVSGFRTAMVWSLGAGLSIWLVFSATLLLTGWIRGRGDR